MFRQFVEVDVDTFTAGFKDGYAGLTNVFSEEEIQEIMTKFQAELRAKAEIKQKEMAERNLKRERNSLMQIKPKKESKPQRAACNIRSFRKALAISPQLRIPLQSIKRDHFGWN
jgi:hypothetical protein